MPKPIAYGLLLVLVGAAASGFKLWPFAPYGKPEFMDHVLAAIGGGLLVMLSEMLIFACWVALRAIFEREPK